MDLPHDPQKNVPSVAYFSMEIGLEPSIPTYSGGLGVLAGDCLRAAADLDVPIVGVTLAHRKGYFLQHLDASGNQTESPAEWSPEDRLRPMPERVNVPIQGRKVHLRAWQYLITGVTGFRVPVFLLDADLPENHPDDRILTDHLYGGDPRYRLCQEAILGMGGVAMLRALGYRDLRAFHMNEGHSALLSLALLQEQLDGRPMGATTEKDREEVIRRCVFTTHTPVAAGHDQFPPDLVRQVLGSEVGRALAEIGCCLDEKLNMTYLGLFFSRYINGVAMRHWQVSRGMFPGYPINSITNGVHAATWASQPFQNLFDRHVPEWRRDNLNLRYAVGIPLHELKSAHEEAKGQLLAEVQRRTGIALRPDAMTIGFARRAATYKRADLLFSDLERLKRIDRQVGPLQIIFSGKAHPRDEGGKAIIRRVIEAARLVGDEIPVIYLEEYDMAIAKQLCAGVDLWLNTPQKPQEASGTSGMKAALNAVPSLSVLDGWWIEGHVEGVTGWSVGESWELESSPARESTSLYDKLETEILPMFYGRPTAYAGIMRSCIALNGSFFNAQRMVQQYVNNAYDL